MDAWERDVDRVTARLATVVYQLTDPNLTVALQCAALSDIDLVESSGTLKDALQSRLAWLLTKVATEVQVHCSARAQRLTQLASLCGPVPTSAPGTMVFTLSADHPKKWNHDLHVLTAELILQRVIPIGTSSSVATDQNAIFSEFPAAGKVQETVPIQARRTSTKTKKAGLTQLAVAIETAYEGFMPDSNLKVSSGQDSDPKSETFGHSQIWLMRWGTTGTSLTPTESPQYRIAPPLDTRLWTGTCDVHGIDNSGANLGTLTTPTAKHFRAEDVDAWGANFLSAVSELFEPDPATNLAVQVNSQDNHDVYDVPTLSTGTDRFTAFAQQKTAIATAIAATIHTIERQQTSEDRATQNDSAQTTAVQTFTEALLKSLRADYLTSALVQRVLTYNGQVENSKSTIVQGRVVAKVTDSAANNSNSPPTSFTHAAPSVPAFSMSAAQVPLASGNQVLTSLLTANHPAEQKSLDLKMKFAVGFLEHLRHTVQDTTIGSWLKFAIPDSTLEVDLGNFQVPIPLRRFPGAPKLFSQAAAPMNVNASDVTDTLTWKYTVRVGQPDADQDTLNLRLVFNESLAEPPDSLQASPSDNPGEALIPALADFNENWPTLRGMLPDGAIETSAQTEAAKSVFQLVQAVAEPWGTWSPTHTAPAPPVPTGANVVAYDYQLKWTDGILDVTVPNGAPVPHGATKKSGSTTSAGTNTSTIYTLTAEPSVDLVFHNLYVIDYQSCRAYAWVTRNESLNWEFEYRTEAVKLSSPVVPRIVSSGIALPSTTSKELFAALLESVLTPPAGAVQFSSTQLVKSPRRVRDCRSDALRLRDGSTHVGGNSNKVPDGIFDGGGRQRDEDDGRSQRGSVPQPMED